MLLPRIVVLGGLPGSGKSTWARQQTGAVLSSDEIRLWLAGDATDQTIHREVFATLRYLLRRRLEMRRPVTYIDATNLTVRDRRAYIHLGQLHGARVEAMFFNASVEECKSRNRGRSRVVPDDAIDWMARRMVLPTIAEGFDAITILPSTTVAPIATQQQAPIE